MNRLKQYIKDKNWVEVLNPDDRAATIKYLHSLDIDRDILAMDGHSLVGQERRDFYEDRS